MVHEWQSRPMTGKPPGNKVNCFNNQLSKICSFAAT
jgi:hypothetical protein